MKKIEQEIQSSFSLWKGPEVDGVTQSMLSAFLVCRERFRVKYVLGLRSVDEFNHRIEYGNMWHECERYHSLGSCWETKLKEYAKSLCQKYPLQQEQVLHWYNMCKVQYPLYLCYWARHKRNSGLTPLLREQVFKVPYRLPSGRTVLLRGRWDGVDLLGKGSSAAVYLLEHKTKGDIREEQIKRQLQFDLQVMLYLVALLKYSRDDGKGLATYGTAKGVRYNVVRRPLSGGKGSIRQHKATKSKPAETSEAFYRRLAGLIKGDPGYYFMRWQVEVIPQDMKDYQHRYLNNHLEQLCLWWDWISSPKGLEDPFASPVHWQTPYGIYNILAEGGSSEVDEYLATGSTLGLRRADRLFEELLD